MTTSATIRDLKAGETCEVQGSGAKPYIVKNIGGVYSCSCIAWRTQSLPIDRRTCKHIRRVRGDEAETARLGGGELSTLVPEPKASAPPIMLANSWNEDIDPTGYLMSEKLDGVRAYWDGKNFISRQGNVYHAPAWFKAGLPKIVLDGELWMARKAFQKTISIVRRMDAGDEWKKIIFRVFDAPTEDLGFEERVVKATKLLQKGKPKYATMLGQILCRSRDHLYKLLAEIEETGGEGLMLRKPDSMYTVGRSSDLLKVKSFKDDEAEVIGSYAGKGKHKGRIGGLEVKWNGVEFRLGTGFSDAERENPPKIGSMVTFRYQELSDGGVPRFPSFVAVRDGY